MRLLTVTLALAFSLAFPACASTRLPRGALCGEIVDAPVLSIIPTSLAGEEASKKWITATFGSKATEIQWASHVDGRYSLKWLVDGNRAYSLELDSNEVGVAIGLMWTQRVPIVDRKSVV